MKKRLLFLLFFLFASLLQVSANDRYTVQIDIRKAYISGICIIHEEEEVVTASIMNEFGVSALTYKYNKTSGKVKILNIFKPMNKWYIKRVLKKDLKKITQEMPLQDPLTYENRKYNIIYQFTPLNDEVAK